MGEKYADHGDTPGFCLVRLLALLVYSKARKAKRRERRAEPSKPGLYFIVICEKGKFRILIELRIRIWQKSKDKVATN